MHADQANMSIKHLLKQVYAAHVNKIKDLEEQVTDLKDKLAEANRKLKDSEPECKRCAELEEAFKSCKSALFEQTKWFANLGQKFSVFGNSQNKRHSKNVAEQPKEDSKNQAEISLNTQMNTTYEKSLIFKNNLLQNLMSLNPNENQDFLDLGSTPFDMNLLHDYSTLNADSLILAPDTVGVTDPKPLGHKMETNYDNELTKTKSTIITASKKLDGEVAYSADIKDCQEINKKTKKRPHIESSDQEKVIKKLNKNNSHMGESSLKTTSSKVGIDSPLNMELAIDNVTARTENSEISHDVMHHDDTKNEAQPLDVEICEDLIACSDDTSCTKTQSSLGKEKQIGIDVIDTLLHVSPSLLPLNKNSKTILGKQHTSSEDINDFQPSVMNKKSIEDDGAWTVCDKKKFKKEQKRLVKSTSKFKMHLDSLPLNYKKPNYRQTKLSKSIFKPKASNSGNNTSMCDKKSDKIISDFNTNSSSADESDRKLTPIQNIGKCSTVDFDATCIPDNYEYEIIPSGNGNRGKPLTEKPRNSLDSSVELINGESGDENLNVSSNTSPKHFEMLKIKTVKSDSNDNNKDKAIFEDFISTSKGAVNNENQNSFDRLPKKDEPNYKYKEETVRKKTERKQLDGFDCKECENYYSELGLSDKEKQERLKKCSRHRAKFAPPPTPEYFWELEFPDTQECKARGYLNETQKVKLKSHRRRPLDL